MPSPADFNPPFRPASPPQTVEPVAAVLALLLPGLGHFYLREVKRALLIASGVLGLFFSGILIGGIDVIDRREDFVWFLGQALVGPVAFGIDHAHQTRFKAYDTATSPWTLRSGRPDEQAERVTDPGNSGRAVRVWKSAPGAMPPNTKSLGRMNEVGTLYATIAGMLNLIAVFDAAWHRRRPEAAP